MLEKLRRYLEPVKSLEPSEGKEYLREQEEGSFTLLDVRQPKEYEADHIPGAKLIPLPSLSNSLDELAKDKPVVVYCAVGGRSKAAAHLLAGQGFKEVYNLKGGIKAYEGQKAEGPVSLNMDMITGDESPSQIIQLAYGMEQALGDFYRGMAGQTDNKDVTELLKKLASIEDKHKEYLLELYKHTVNEEPDRESFEAHVSSNVLEGGFNSEELATKNSEILSSVTGLLDVSMMLETQALDLYLRFADKAEEDQAKQVLFKIADEEKQHLASLGQLREESS